MKIVVYRSVCNLNPSNQLFYRADWPVAHMREVLVNSSPFVVLRIVVFELLVFNPINYLMARWIPTKL
jgi:hypothetical protein